MPKRRVIPLLLGILLLAAACGESGASGDDGIATLTDTDETTVQSDDDSGSTDGGDSEQAALEFAQCIRDGGIDFPDPTVDEEGNPSFAAAFQAAQDGSFDARSEEFRQALADCEDLIDGFAFGRGGANVGVEQIQEALLPYTECLRDEGLDVGDVNLGGGQPGAGAGGEQQGGGRREGGFDPAARLAAFLGLDTEDPEVEAAMATCQPILIELIASIAPEG
jgi:hypothetical protein